MLKLDLTKEPNFKTSEERKKVKLHTCALEHAFVQKSTKTQKTHSKFKKKPKKKYFFS